MEYVITNDKGLFWAGTYWATEYPDAVLFGSQTKAFSAAERVYHRTYTDVYVIVNYGMDNQEIVDIIL
jgi:hypothetical protein